MDIPAKYNPSEVEDKWYAYWLKNKFFHSEPDEREPYTIVIPPPNVTGILHMGHVLNNTLNDVLVRKARMDGKNSCWVPGTDHASIATESKVVAKLKSQGINKGNISFLSTLGNGKKNTEALSLVNCVNSEHHAIGIEPSLLWILIFQKLLSTPLSIFITKDIYIGVSEW